MPATTALGRTATICLIGTLAFCTQGLVAQSPTIAFTDVAPGLGLADDVYYGESNHGLGVNWIDFNNDTWPDLFLVNGMRDGVKQPSHLFRNDGGTFTNVDELLPVLPDVEMMGSVYADYDNDGDLDIYIYTAVDRRGGNQGLGGPANLFLENQWMENGEQVISGLPLFTEVAAARGIDDLLPVPLADGPAYVSTTASWLDYDRDGHLDLYVGHWAGGGTSRGQDKLYRNNGVGAFEDVTSTSGVNPSFRDALAVAAAHLDDDLDPDVYVGNYATFGQDQVYENQSGGGFAEVIGDSPGVGDDARFAMGIAVGDIELDGDWDVYISDASFASGCMNIFYENLGGPGIRFADDSSCTRGISSVASWGVNFFDADQDGYEDLFVSALAIGAPHRLYQNNQDGTFTRVLNLDSPEGGGKGSAVADYDGDGDLDVGVVNQDGRFQLFENQTANPGNWLQVDLVGAGPGSSGSNLDAVGALVRVTTGGQQFMRQVTGGNSAHSQDSQTLHFGLGSATQADQIEVLWPSGLVDTSMVNVPHGTGVVLFENVAAPTVEITQPVDGAIFGDGVTISFQASANDPQEGDLATDLVWDSDQIGVIGTGGSFATVLTAGTHIITASVVDFDGNPGSDTVAITVAPPGGLPPNVSITAPDDGSVHIEGNLIPFTGSSDDFEDGDLSHLISWDSDIDSHLGDGASISVGLTEGTHIVTASVVDSDGNASSTSISVTVDAAGGGFELTLTSIGSHDGTLFESTEDSDVGGRVNSLSSSNGALQIGDRNDDTQTKVVVSFDTSAIPGNAAIQSAVLRLQRGTAIGSSPFVTHGACYADVSSGGFGGDEALVASDFEAAATVSQSATLSAPLANLDWSEGTLDAAGRAAVNIAGVTQFRVYCALDDNDDGGRDAIGFRSGDFNDASAHPQLVVTYSLGPPPQSIARQWNEELLDAIRGDLARPTMHARNLYHTAVAMWDSWAAYDDVAGTVLHHERASATDVEAARAETLSFAVYRLLSWRFLGSPSATETLQSFDDKMDSLGYDRGFTSTVGDTPAALGNRIAEMMINYGLSDGSNETGGFENLYYVPVNEPLAPEFPGNPNLTDPNRWQPLAIDPFVDQSGNPLPGFPEFLSPEWGIVKSFSLSPDDLTIYNRDGFDYFVYHDPGPPPLLSNPDYKSGFEQVVEWSGFLDPADGVMIDISPASRGDNTLGTNDGDGHDVNPVTGLPYVPNIVPAGDYYRVLAEFWADGPESETPPGHWFTIANYVADHPLVEKRFGGTGPVLDDLEWDVKVYLVLGGAMHDVAVSAWGVKGWYDYIRPVSAIRYLCDNGQSSDDTLPSYDINGINLHPGYIELATDVTTGPGGIHEHLGIESIDKIAIYAWRGPDFISDPNLDTAGVGWILCENWWPYQRPSFVTPPFAGYVSGHSTFSRAAAEVMTLLTGDPYFPGGMGVFLAPQNEFLVFEEGPSVDVELQWATYADASDETSLSRIHGGIHPTADDIPGRLMGYVMGPDAFDFANLYFDGELGVAPTVEITLPADNSVFIVGSTIDFAGIATDPDDGDLTGDLVWTSSIDAQIGIGGSFSSVLSLGAHTITASVTDLDGNSSSSSITVTVNPDGGTTEVILTSIGQQDGTIFESSEDSDVGGRVNISAATLQLGDRKDDVQTKVVVSFDTSGIPSGATILSATLRLQRGLTRGTNPFATHGACYVDVIGGAFSGDVDLEATDFEASATASQSATMSNAAANLDWSEASLDGAGLAAIDTAGTTQFRLYFALDDDDDAVRDAIGYRSGEFSDAASQPQLVVTYLP